MKNLLFYLFILAFTASCVKHRSQSHLEKGEAKVEANDLNGALAEFDRAIELQRDNGELYKKRGYLKFQMNDLEGALSDLNTADVKNAADAELYKTRADIYLKNKEMRK